MGDRLGTLGVVAFFCQNWGLTLVTVLQNMCFLQKKYKNLTVASFFVKPQTSLERYANVTLAFCKVPKNAKG